MSGSSSVLIPPYVKDTLTFRGIIQQPRNCLLSDRMQVLLLRSN